LRTLPLEERSLLESQPGQICSTRASESDPSRAPRAAVFSAALVVIRTRFVYQSSLASAAASLAIP